MLFGSGKRELSVLVLRDADGIADAVRAALSTAGPEERPGLERAAAIIAEAADASAAELRGRWVRQRLDAAGIKGPADSVTAIKALRQAEPTLSLWAAVSLARDAEAG
ncbi:hypothetical protein FBY35_2784 [Streptomyces sp. SLBN-118]|uniref:hypothetical protein n=1 Tax=Streptomyces sp. SLBN-118 TaxID=2768454 RepID=UPI0011522375|nr:hypothetical protein [Streptomyces sp. SLBN-118]TQK52352.1 hypothetical protein FBY35_2784 [Streptomyces sp. SLBN-118]